MIDAELPLPHLSNSTPDDEKTEDSSGGSGKTSTSQAFPTAMRFQAEEIDSTTPSILNAPEIRPSAPPMPSGFTGFSQSGYSFPQDPAPFEEVMEGYDSEPTWSTVVDTNIGSTPGDSNYSSGFGNQPGFSQGDAPPYADASSYSNNPSSYSPGDFYQEDQFRSWEEIGKSPTEIDTQAPTSFYQADSDLVERVQAPKPTDQESENRNQQGLRESADDSISAGQGVLNVQNRLAEGLELLKAGRAAISTVRLHKFCTRNCF